MTTSQQTPTTQAATITALSQRIGNLKRKGLPVKSVMVKENGKRFARYWLDTPVTNAADEVTK